MKHMFDPLSSQILIQELYLSNIQGLNTSLLQSLTG